MIDSLLEPKPLPEWLLDIFPKCGDRLTNQSRAAAPGSKGVVSQGQRNNRLTSLAGTMRHRGMSVEAIEAALLAENARYEPPLPEDEVGGVARSVSHYPSGEELAIQWPEPMAEEAFYGLVGDIVRTIEPHTEADRVALLVNTLAYVGNAVGRTVHGVAEADWHGTNLFTVMVGETAKGRKGSSRGHINELFARVDPVWTHTRTVGGLSSGEGLIWAVRDPLEKTEAIKEKVDTQANMRR